MPSIFPSTSLSATSRVVVSAILLCVCCGGNANSEALGDNLATLPLPPEEAAVAPAGWTAAQLALDGGAKRKTVLLRDGADEAEAFAVISEGCREAGVGDDQASHIARQWKLNKISDQPTGLMINPRRKNIFQRFLGGMAVLAEEQAFFVLETGTWDGASASWIAEHLLKHPMSLLVCLDTWDGAPENENANFNMAFVEERFHRNIARVNHGERVIALKGDSLRSLAGLLARGLASSFDAVYVDASHEMKDVLGDALLSFRLLKVGGIMMFDDYWMRGVARATTAFEEALGDSVQVLYRDKDHLVVMKATNDRFATRDSEFVLGDESRLENVANGGPMP